MSGPLRWVASVLGVLILVALIAPALIGAHVREQLSAPLWLAPGVALRAEVVDGSWWMQMYDTQAVLEPYLPPGLEPSERRPDSFNGVIELRHNPLILLMGTVAGWPGYVEGELRFGAPFAARIYQTTDGQFDVTGALNAGAGALTADLSAPSGQLQLRHGPSHQAHVGDSPIFKLGVESATLGLRVPLFEAWAPIKFQATVTTTDGRLRAQGEVARDRPGISAALISDTRQVDALATSVMTAELQRDGVAGVRPDIVAALAKRRIDALVQLGLLHLQDGQFSTEIEWSGTGVHVNGEPLQMPVFAAPTL